MVGKTKEPEKKGENGGGGKNVYFLASLLVKGVKEVKSKKEKKEE